MRVKSAPTPVARKPVAILPEERAFIDALKIAGEGRDFKPLAHLSDDLRRLTQACDETGGKGTLTFKLKVQSKGHPHIVFVMEPPVLKLPERGMAERLAFATPEGEIVTHNPEEMIFADILRTTETNAQE